MFHSRIFGSLAFCSLILLCALVFCSGAIAQTTTAWDGPTYPTWKGVMSGAGVTPTYKVTPGDNPLIFIQVMTTTDWTGSFWGKEFDGTMVQITPSFSTDADTSLTPGANVHFEFPDIKCEWIQTHSGDAEMWGEKE